MCICLMADIPDKAVGGSVEYVVQGHDYVDRTHARCEMTRIDRKVGYEEMPDFLAEPGQLLQFELPEIRRGVHFIQERCRCVVVR